MRAKNHNTADLEDPIIQRSNGLTYFFIVFVLRNHKRVLITTKTEESIKLIKFNTVSFISYRSHQVTGQLYMYKTGHPVVDVL